MEWRSLVVCGTQNVQSVLSQNGDEITPRFQSIVQSIIWFHGAWDSGRLIRDFYFLFFLMADADIFKSSHTYLYSALYNTDCFSFTIKSCIIHQRFKLKVLLQIRSITVSVLQSSWTVNQIQFSFKQLDIWLWIWYHTISYNKKSK